MSDTDLWLATRGLAYACIVRSTEPPSAKSHIHHPIGPSPPTYRFPIGTTRSVHLLHPRRVLTPRRCPLLERRQVGVVPRSVLVER